MTTTLSQERQQIRVLGADHAIAARLHLAWLVEQTQQRLGLSQQMADANGDGPFVRAARAANTTCEWYAEVSDDEFGYWNDQWGQPGVQTFTCDEPATRYLIDPWDNLPVYLCAEHHKDATRVG